MAFRRFAAEGGSPHRGSLMSSFGCRPSPRFMVTCFLLLALTFATWTVYTVGTVHDVLRLVQSPFYGSGENESGYFSEGPPPPGPPAQGLGDAGDVSQLPPQSSSMVPPPSPPKEDMQAIPTKNKGGSQSGHGTSPSFGVQKVIGLVFFGRKELVQVLDCYLKRNLKENGGMLDEVIFAVHTDNESDLKYLDELVTTSKSYRKHVAQGNYEWWLGSWEPVQDPEAIYIKIDDDVVFIEDSTIPAMVKRLQDNPQYFAVSANIVNNPALAWVHYSMGLFEPFWPEMKKPKGKASTSWKPSTLPSYEGPREGPEDFPADGSAPAPFEGHRWLPVRMKPGDKPYDISLTPASTLTYNAFGPSLKNWAASAQGHYSFLTHLERNELYKYHFDVWDYAYERLSINFFGVRGRDIIDVFPFPQKDDEDYVTVVRPKELGRHVVVEGRGVAVHLAFGPQYTAHDGRGVRWTDALTRYASYANENICGTTMPKSSQSSAE